MVPSWLHNEKVLAELRRGGRAHLKQISGLATPLALKERRRQRPGYGAFLEEYERHTKLAYFEPSHDAFLKALSSDVDRPFLANDGGEQAVGRFLRMATSPDTQDRQTAAAWARDIGNALDPPRQRGQASKLDSRRIAVLFRCRRAQNASLHRRLQEFATPPPAEWLPAFRRHGGEPVTMQEKEWPRLAAIEWVAAALDVSDATVERHLKKAKGRPRKQ